jgi:hypothetical protein
MQITVQITVKSEQGEPEVIQEVARLERGPLQPDTLGLSPAAARAILAGLDQGSDVLLKALLPGENAPSTPATPLVIAWTAATSMPPANARGLSRPPSWGRP